MKRILILLPILFLFFEFSSFNVDAQCPWKKVNCKNRCGRFIDENNNSICDLSEPTKLDTVKEVEKTVVVKKQVVVEKVVEVNKKRCEGCKHEKCVESESVDNAKITENTTTDGDDEFKSMDSTEVDTTSVVNVNDASSTEEKDKPYSLIFISSLTVGLYLISWFAKNRKWIKFSTHRRIWNVLLLLTFLISCLFGFFLVIQINYHFVFDWYKTVLYWHVQVGIGMTIVAVLHILWHTKYFVNLFKKRQH
jgi:hypothetical protein